MTTMREQFDSAKAYIQTKEYAKARKILLKINHPQAAKWLTHLDKLDPPKQGVNWTRLLISLGIVLFICVAGITAVVISGQSAVKEERARADVLNYCSTVVSIAGGNTSNCGQWVESVMISQKEIILSCFDRFSNSTPDFTGCLAIARVFPPPM